MRTVNSTIRLHGWMSRLICVFSRRKPKIIGFITQRTIISCMKRFCTHCKIFKDRTQLTCHERYLKGEVAYFQTRHNMAYHDHLRFPGAFSFWTIGFILFSPACFRQHHAFHHLHFRGQAATFALLYCINRFPEPVVRLEPQVIDHVQVVGLEDLAGGSTQEGQHHGSKVKHCGRFCEKKKKTLM